MPMAARTWMKDSGITTSSRRTSIGAIRLARRPGRYAAKADGRRGV
ncbi:MAG: hypothetical protein H7270_09315 [Dermatophilaceae bacterium]|nr:hypothetical protein [Dermatophilaceae bacterium]